MKKKTSVVATSVAAIAVCASLIAGSTYALFTSDDEVDIAISSGKVSVSATIENVKASHTVETAKEVYSEVDGLYGGEKVDFEDGVLTLKNVVPGDKVTFDIVVENTSTVSVLYRTKINAVEDNGLMYGLEFNVDGKDYSGLVSYVSEWTTWAEAGKKTIPVSVELPFGAGNEYQELSCKIAYFVEAVQGNGYKEDESELIKTHVGTAAELEAAILNGGKIKLINDISVEGATPTAATVSDHLTFNEDTELDLNGKTLTLNNKIIGIGELNGAKNDANVKIFNGKVVSTNTAASGFADCAFDVYGNNDASKKQSSLTLDNVDIESYGYGLGIRNCRVNTNEPLVVVNGGTITTKHPYACALGTTGILDKSTGLSEYNGGAVVMNGTTINSAGSGIMLTVNVALELNDVTINSRMQCLTIRAGEVKLNGCTLNNNVYTLEEYNTACAGLTYTTGYMSKKYVNSVADADLGTWNASNNTDIAAIVIGNRVSATTTSYANSAKVTIVDTEINQTNGINADEGALVYIHGDSRNYTATFNYSYTDAYEGVQLATTDIVRNGDLTKITVGKVATVDLADAEATLKTFCPTCRNEGGDHSKHNVVFEMADGKANVVRNSAHIQYADLDFENAKYQITVNYDISQLVEDWLVAFDCGENKSWQDLQLGFTKEGDTYYAHNTLFVKSLATAKKVELNSTEVEAVYTFVKEGDVLKLTLTLNGEEFVTKTANYVAGVEVMWNVYTVSNTPGVEAMISDNALVAITGLSFLELAK